MNAPSSLFAANALAGRVAVVTGGSSGIGLATVGLLLDCGAAVALGVVATPFAALLPLLNMGTNETNDCAPLVGEQGKKNQAGASKNGKAEPPAKKPASAKNGKAADDRANWPSSKAKP